MGNRNEPSRTSKRSSLMSEAVLFMVPCLLAMACAGTELRRSEEQIAEALLRELPKGTTPAQVQARLQERGASLDPLVMLNCAPDPIPSEVDPRAKSYLRVYLGAYREFFVFSTDVIAFFSFDESDELIGLKVRKERDAP